MSSSNGTGHVWTEDELRHNYLKRTEAQRRVEDERQAASGAIDVKIAAGLGYSDATEMKRHVNIVAAERSKMMTRIRSLTSRQDLDAGS